jgi:protein SCO1/2
MRRTRINVRAVLTACLLTAAWPTLAPGAEASGIQTTGFGARAERTSGPSAAYRLALWPQQARAPDFKLVDFDGRPRSLADFSGRILVVFFGFVRCPDVCPAELFKLALVMKQLGRLSERVQVLFVTLDPEHDTPTMLKSYVKTFDPRFVGLTGTAAQIDEAADRFFVEYARVTAGADYSIDHSTSTFVLDGGRRLRLVGTPNTSISDFVHDLAALAEE